MCLPLSYEHFSKGCSFVISIHAVPGIPEPKWNPTIVLLLKGRPIKRKGHPPHKEGPPSSQRDAIPPKKWADLTPTGTEELRSTASTFINCKYVSLPSDDKANEYSLLIRVGPDTGY